MSRNCASDARSSERDNSAERIESVVCVAGQGARQGVVVWKTGIV